MGNAAAVKRSFAQQAQNVGGGAQIVQDKRPAVALRQFELGAQRGLLDGFVRHIRPRQVVQPDFAHPQLRVLPQHVFQLRQTVDGGFQAA